jgi:hypothetical protein
MIETCLLGHSCAAVAPAVDICVVRVAIASTLARIMIDFKFVSISKVSACLAWNG